MDKKKKKRSLRSSAKSSTNEPIDKENVLSTTRAVAGTALATSKPSKAETKTHEATDVSPQQSRNEPSTLHASNHSPKKKTQKPTQQEIMKMTLPSMKATTNIQAIATEIAKIRNRTQMPSQAAVDHVIEYIYNHRQSANQRKLGLDQLVYIEKRAKIRKQSYVYEGGKMVTTNLVSPDEDVAMETNPVKEATAEEEASDDEILAEYLKKITKEQSESRQEAELTDALPTPEILSADHLTHGTENTLTLQTDEINIIDVFGANQQKGNAKPTEQSEKASSKGRGEVIETGKADERTWLSDEENVQSTTRAAAGTASATSKPSKAEIKTREGTDVSPQQPRNEPSTSRASENSPKKKAKKPTQQEIIKVSLATMKAKTNIRAIEDKTQKPTKAVVDRFIDQNYAQRHNRANRSKLGLDGLVCIEKRAKAKKQSYLYEGGKMVTIDHVSSDEDVAMETNAVKEDTTEKELLPENSDDETLAEDVKKTMEEQSKSRLEAELTGALPQTTTAPELLNVDHSTNSTESPPTRQMDEVNTIDVFGANQQKDNAKPTEQFENTANEGSDEVAEIGQADERTWRIASDFQREIFEFTYEEFVAHTNIVALQRKWVEENHPEKDFLEDDENDYLKFYYGIRLNLKLWRRSILKNLKYKVCDCKPNKTFVDSQHPNSESQCSPSVFASVSEQLMLELQRRITAANQPTQDPLGIQNVTEMQSGSAKKRVSVEQAEMPGPKSKKQKVTVQVHHNPAEVFSNRATTSTASGDTMPNEPVEKSQEPEINESPLEHSRNYLLKESNSTEKSNLSPSSSNPAYELILAEIQTLNENLSKCLTAIQQLMSMLQSF